MNIRKTEDYVIPLLVLFFVFLFLVLSISFYLQTQDVRQGYTESQERTISQYALQANMTSRSLLDVSGLLAQRYLQELVQIINATDEQPYSDSELNVPLKRSLGDGYMGFMVFDREARLKYVSSEEISKENRDFIEQELQTFKTDPRFLHQIFVSPNNQLFTMVGIYQQEKRVGFLILRKPLRYYTDALNIYSPGFSLALAVPSQDRWFAVGIGTQVNKIDLDSMPAGLPLTHTDWHVVSVPDRHYLFLQVIRLLYPKLLFLGVYICLAIWSMRVIRFMQKTHQASLMQATEKSVRAEQALSCLEEVVITTDLDGNIIYANQAAEHWLPQDSLIELGGKLSVQMPIPGAAWMKPIDVKRLEQQQAYVQELMIDLHGSIRTVALSYQLIKHKDKLLGVVWLLRDISSQVADRELLEESRAKYRALYEGAGVAMWHVDIATARAWLANLGEQSIEQYIDSHSPQSSQLVSLFEIIDMNPAAMKLHGIQDKSLMSKSVNELFTGANQELFIRFAEAIQQEEQQFCMEAKARSLDGYLRYYVVNVIIDSVGLDQALISFVDISDRIKAEQALKNSERFWGQVLAALPDSVYVNDLIEKKTVYSSRHVAALLGYSDAEIEQIEHWRDLVLDEDKPKVDNALNQLRNMKPGEVLETILKMRHTNGEERILRFRDCVFTSGENGLSKYYVGIGRDVTKEEDAKYKLAFNERQYRLLAEGISDIVISLDKELNLTYVSPSVEKILGAIPERVISEGLELVINDDSIQRMQILARKDLHDALMDKIQERDNHKVRSLDLQARSMSGKSVVLEVQSSVLRGDDGDIEGILAIGRDVTQRRRIEQEVRTAAEVFENSSEAIVVTDPNGGIQQVNRAFSNMTGYELIDIKLKNPFVLLAPDLSKAQKRDIRESLFKDGYWQGEISYRNRQGQTRPSWTGVTALRDHSGKVQSHISISSDISERKVNEARIERLAYFDPLTGLPNRSQMHETLDELIVDQYQHAAMLFIDLDRFKPINDTMGHPIGDQVLKEVAQRLRSSIRPQDLVARIGGDEFTVIMPGFETGASVSDEAVEGSERILHQLMQPFVVEEQNLYLSASIGIALFPQDATNGTDLLRNADTAMYHAKAMGKNNFQFYAEEMNTKALHRLEMENNLHQALTHEEFELFYQPQWDTARNCLHGVEALLRWRRPQHGLVGPDVFVPIIEETGLIVPVGEWVLRAACEQIIDWQEAGLDVPTVAVNISARQFKDEQMLDRICCIVDETGVDPELIELELTESVLMDDVERTLAILHETRRMGFHISIDDFGTGYSSLSYLKQFPVDNLKVDSSFIRSLPHNQEDAQITRTIVAMATNLGLGVIAEGVETQAQQEFLQDVGCYRVQGFRYSRPVSAEQLAQQFLDSEIEAEFELESSLP